VCCVPQNITINNSYSVFREAETVFMGACTVGEGLENIYLYKRAAQKCQIHG